MPRAIKIDRESALQSAPLHPQEFVVGITESLKFIFERPLQKLASTDDKKKTKMGIRSTRNRI
jgi:hypothetical protein